MDSVDAVSKWGEPVSLTARCKSLDVEVLIRWGEYLGLEKTAVLTRIGNAPATEAEWPLSTNNQATFFPDGGDVQFLRALLPEQRLIAQVTPHSESPRTAIFSLVGISEAIKPIQEACKDRFVDLDPELEGMHQELRTLLSPEDHSAWDAGWRDSRILDAKCSGPGLTSELKSILQKSVEEQSIELERHADMCSILLGFSSHGKEQVELYFQQRLDLLKPSLPAEAATSTVTSKGRDLKDLLSVEDQSKLDEAWDNPVALEANCIGERLSEAARDFSRASKTSREGLIAAHSRMCSRLLRLSPSGEQVLRGFIGDMVPNESGGG